MCDTFWKERRKKIGRIFQIFGLCMGDICSRHITCLHTSDFTQYFSPNHSIFCEIGFTNVVSRERAGTTTHSPGI